LRGPRFVVAAFALLACQSRTEVLLGVVTDLRAPTALDHVKLLVSRADTGVVELQQDWDITGIPDRVFNLPGSYGISSDNGDVAIEADLLGSLGGNVTVERTAILSLVDGQTLFYRMGLSTSCSTLGSNSCGSGMTCIEGVCKDPHADSTTFPAFDPSLVDTLTCNSGTAYIDTDTGTPMTFSANAAQCPSGMCSEGTCYNPPQPKSGGCVIPQLYNVTFGCSSNCNMPIYPGMTTSLSVTDGQGDANYVANPSDGFDGTCTSTATAGSAGCTSMFSCTISTGANGQASGTILWNGANARGSAVYTLSSPESCTSTCMLTIGP
jgi:hypothetical protein